MKYLRIVAPVFVVIAIAIYLIFGYLSKSSKTEHINLDDLTPLETTSSNGISTTNTDKIYVDISGAVINPGIYQLALGSRVVDVLKKAGGISKYADVLYVSQNLNLAQKLKDSEKIYIPFEFDRDLLQLSGKLNLICSQNIKVSGNSTTDGSMMNDDNTSTNGGVLVDVNTASKQTLLDLPGIGEAFATKIIEGRPYVNIDAFYEYIKFGASTKEKLIKLLKVD